MVDVRANLNIFTSRLFFTFLEMHYVPHIKIELPKHLRDKCPAVQLGQEQVFLGKKVTSMLLHTSCYKCCTTAKEYFDLRATLEICYCGVF